MLPDSPIASPQSLTTEATDDVTKWLETQRQLASSTNLALVTVGPENDYFGEVANDTSICQAFQADPEKAARCAEFCGRARERALTSGEMITYRCHAQLNCFAAQIKADGNGSPLVIIGGRAFLSARDYREFMKDEPSPDIALFRNLKFTDAQDFTGASHLILSAAREQLAQTNGTKLQIVEPSAVTPSEPPPQLLTPEELEAYFNGSFEHGCREALRIIGMHFHIRSAVLLMRGGKHLIARAAGGEKRDDLIRLTLTANDPLVARLYEQSTSPQSLRLTEEEKAPLRQQADFNSAEAFPLFIGDELTGVLLVVDTPLNAEAREGILEFGQQIIVPLELARLRSEIHERTQAINQWQDFARTLAALSDPAQIYAMILKQSVEVLGAERASLLVLEEDSQELAFKASRGLSEEIVNSTRMRLGEGIAGAVLERGVPLLVSDVDDDEWVAARAQRSCRTGSFISFPIQIGGRRIGVLNIADRVTGENYGVSDLNWLKSIAPHAAAALERIDLREKAQRFQLMSITDPLTGLLNRRYLEERFAEEVERSKRYHYPLSFIMIDIDGFKSYNDTFGHQAGDDILRATAQCIRGSLRNFDVAARYGGEEFSLVLPETEITSATALAERLRREVERHLGADSPLARRPVTISVGVASLGPVLQTTHKVMRAADQALYAAKKQGKNRVIVYNNALGPNLS